MRLDELFESFNTELHTEWSSRGNEKIGSFSVDERDYRISIANLGQLTLPSSGKSATLFEVSFKGKDHDQNDDEYSAEGTKTATTKHSAAVFGTVLNSVQRQLSNLQTCDIVLFAAKDIDASYKSRQKMYMTMSRVLSKRLDLDWSSKTIPGATVFLLSKTLLSESDLSELLHQYIMES